jgi:predicted metal-dependent HD superfamily phosphohydrolase
MAKTTFFKMFKTLARFSPRRDVFAHLTFLYANVDRHLHLLKTMFDQIIHNTPKPAWNPNSSSEKVFPVETNIWWFLIC